MCRVGSTKSTHSLTHALRSIFKVVPTRLLVHLLQSITFCVYLLTAIKCSYSSFIIYEYITNAGCNNAFQINSTCYKIHKEDKVRWFTAVNRCLSNNATLAVFDDNVRQYFPSSLLSDNAWIGLLKSWWTWSGLRQLKLDYWL